jgi:hypothetical protein
MNGPPLPTAQHSDADAQAMSASWLFAAVVPVLFGELAVAHALPPHVSINV